MNRASNPLESFARDLLSAGLELGQRAIARGADQALADVHRRVGKVAKEWDKRVRKARERIAELIPEPEDATEDSEEPLFR